MTSLVCIIPCMVFEKKAKECSDKNPYDKINEVIKMKDIDADLIVMGNSRAAVNYDASLMTSLMGLHCLNIGTPGFSFDCAYHIMYDLYICQNKKPKFIIVETDPCVFFDRITPNYIALLPYINLPELKYYLEMSPQLSNIDKILYIRYFGKLSIVLKELEYLRHPVIQNKQETKTKWVMDDSKKEQSLTVNKDIVEVFALFLKNCKEQDIKVILVCAPFHVDAELNYYDMDGFWKIVRWCNSGKGFPIISYQDYFGSDTSYFSDPGHLNKYGKEVFTRKLCHDLDSFGIISNHI